jgi:Vacuolar protein sorting-associated protein 26
MRGCSYAGQSMFNENETIAKYEIMDGAPVRGETCHYYFNFFMQLLIADFHMLDIRM